MDQKKFPQTKSTIPPMDFLESLKKYTKVRTLSIAFPSSIFSNVPTPQLEAYLVGQIARAAVVFNVSEVIIFEESEDLKGGVSRTDRLVKLFEYAECPQYLRKRIFSIEPDLKYAGLIHPLEAQHHLRSSQLDCPYREGVTTQHEQIELKGELQEFTQVNIGLNRPVIVPGHLDLNNRVTVQVDPSDLKKVQSMLGPVIGTKPQAQIVAPVTPLEKLNLYWGYYVRKANSLSQALRENIFDSGRKNFYDLVIGTSEHGDCIDELDMTKIRKVKDEDKQTSKKNRSEYKHILVVFGGLKGLEFSLSCDNELKDCKDIKDIFDYYINTCPNQGSTTIRTEEAILITLSALRPKLNL